MFGIGGGVGLVIAGVIVENLGIDWIFWSRRDRVGASPRSPPGATSPSRRCACRRAIDYAGAGAADARRCSRCCSAISEGNTWGWTARRDPRPVRRGASCSAPSGSWYELRTRGAAGRHAADARARRVDDEPRRVRDRLRDVRLLHPHPAVRAGARAATGYGFGASVMVAASTCCPARCSCSSPARCPAAISHALRLAPPAAAGHVAAGAAYFLLAALHARAVARSSSAARLLGLGIGLAFAAMANLIVEAVPQEQTGVASGINTIMRSIGGAIGGQVAAAMLTASASAGRVPGESGYTTAFVISGLGAIVALGAGAARPAPRAAVDRDDAGRRTRSPRSTRPRSSAARPSRTTSSRRSERPAVNAEDRLTPEVKAIAIVVVIGAIMSILDTTIVNVALDTLVARARLAARHDPVGLDRLPARARDRHPAHGLGGRALRPQARLDDRRHRLRRSRARCAGSRGAPSR